MAIIKNTPVKRGDKLTAAELNQQFTDANSGFPMNGGNVRNEGVDYMAVDTGGSGSSTGKNGLVLVDANSYTLHAAGASTTVREYSTSASATQIAEKTGLSISAVAGDILRVYWQAQVTTTAGSGLPAGTGRFSTACWAHWLEWDVGAGYVPVTGQSDMDDTIATATTGAPMDKTVATSLVNASVFHLSGGSPTIVNPGPRCSYGSYYYKFTGSQTITKLRIQCRGLFLPRYNPVAGGTAAEFEDRNCLQLMTASGAQQIVFNQLDLSYLLMRGE